MTKLLVYFINTVLPSSSKTNFDRDDKWLKDSWFLYYVFSNFKVPD